MAPDLGDPGKGRPVAEVVINLSASGPLAGRPMTFEIARRFRVVTNILAASITAESGFMSLRVSGEDAGVRDSLRWLIAIGVSVEPGDAASAGFVAEARAGRIEQPPVEDAAFPRPQGSVTCALYMTTPRGILSEPIVYELGARFDLVVNIKGASVTGDTGIMRLELVGRPEVIDQGCRWLAERGVTVERVSKSG